MPPSWKRISLTNHARRRIQERKITLRQIELAIERADRMSNFGNDRRSYKKIRDRVLVVAWHIRDKAAVIRTAFWQD